MDTTKVPDITKLKHSIFKDLGHEKFKVYQKILKAWFTDAGTSKSLELQLSSLFGDKKKLYQLHNCYLISILKTSATSTFGSKYSKKSVSKDSPRINANNTTGDKLLPSLPNDTKPLRPSSVEKLDRCKENKDRIPLKSSSKNESLSIPIKSVDKVPSLTKSHKKVVEEKNKVLNIGKHHGGKTSLVMPSGSGQPVANKNRDIHKHRQPNPKPVKNVDMLHKKLKTNQDVVVVKKEISGFEVEEKRNDMRKGVLHPILSRHHDKGSKVLDWIFKHNLHQNTAAIDGRLKRNKKPTCPKQKRKRLLSVLQRNKKRENSENNSHVKFRQNFDQIEVVDESDNSDDKNWTERVRHKKRKHHQSKRKLKRHAKVQICRRKPSAVLDMDFEVTQDGFHLPHGNIVKNREKIIPNVTHFSKIFEDKLQEDNSLQKYFAPKKGSDQPYLTSGATYHGKFLHQIWQYDLDTIQEEATEMVIKSAYDNIKTWLTEVIKRKKGFQVNSNIAHSFGRDVPNPYVLSRGVFDKERPAMAIGSQTIGMAGPMQVPMILTQEEKERLAIYEEAIKWRDNTDKSFGTVGLQDLYYTLKDNAYLVPNGHLRGKSLAKLHTDMECGNKVQSFKHDHYHGGGEVNLFGVRMLRPVPSADEEFIRPKNDEISEIVRSCF